MLRKVRRLLLKTDVFLVVCLAAILLAAGCDADTDGTEKSGNTLSTRQNESNSADSLQTVEVGTHDDRINVHLLDLLDQATINVLVDPDSVQIYHGNKAAKMYKNIYSSTKNICSNKSGIYVYPKDTVDLEENNLLLKTYPSQYIAFVTKKYSGWLPLSEYTRFYSTVNLDWAGRNASVATWRRYLTYFNVKAEGAFTDDGCGFLISHRFMKDPFNNERDWGRFIKIVLSENEIYLIASDMDGKVDLVIAYQSDIRGKIVEMGQGMDDSVTPAPDQSVAVTSGLTTFDRLSHRSGQWKAAIYGVEDTTHVDLSSLISNGQWTMLKSGITYADTMNVLKYKCDSSISDHNYCGLDEDLVDEVEHTTNIVLVGYRIRKGTVQFIPFHHAAFDGWPSDSNRYLKKRGPMTMKSIYDYRM